MLPARILSARHRFPRGEVPEWSNGAVSKTVVPLRVPRVRIPLSPPELLSRTRTDASARKLVRTLVFRFARQRRAGVRIPLSPPELLSRTRTDASARKLVRTLVLRFARGDPSPTEPLRQHFDNIGCGADGVNSLQTTPRDFNVALQVLAEGFFTLPIIRRNLPRRPLAVAGRDGRPTPSVGVACGIQGFRTGLAADTRTNRPRRPSSFRRSGFRWLSPQYYGARRRRTALENPLRFDQWSPKNLGLPNA